MQLEAHLIAKLFNSVIKHVSKPQQAGNLDIVMCLQSVGNFTKQ